MNKNTLTRTVNHFNFKYIFQRKHLSKSKKPKIEMGTQNSDIDYDWIPKEALQSKIINVFDVIKLIIIHHYSFIKRFLFSCKKLQHSCRTCMQKTTKF